MKMKKRYAMMLSAFVLAFLLAPAMHAKTYDVGLCSYDASNLADIKNTNLRECTDYLNEIRSVTPANTDPLLVASLLDTESNCNPRVNGGIAQVDATRCNPSVEVCPPTPIDEQIEAGLEVFDSNYKAVVEKGIGNKEQAIRFSLLGYNRGTSIAENAIKYSLLDESLSLKGSMLKACKEVYNKEGNGCLYCEKTATGLDKCNDYGLGAKYPDKVLSKYKEACEDIGGEFSDTEIRVAHAVLMNSGR